ncbi:shikimate kinase [Palleronia sediminis]|uniref:Shikimate kinase n=2 Tax=Palleronia sediminis TaxID=2547833 RepID=A0A4V6PPA5_9RHOB|nr:shikimate kinase [Palleronia sediminis]
MGGLLRTVVMVGMPGAGKTAVGTATARRLGVPFRDSDAEIERAARRTIAEIFEREGEPFFRERETAVLRRILSEPPCILSTGGGAYLQARNREAIRAEGVALWLRAELDLLWSRVRHKTTRPLLRTADPRATLAELARAREPFYAEAEIVVDSLPDLTVDQMAGRVAAALKAHPGVIEGPRA